MSPTAPNRNNTVTFPGYFRDIFNHKTLIINKSIKLKISATFLKPKPLTNYYITATTNNQLFLTYFSKHMRLKILSSLYCLFSCIIVTAQVSKKANRSYETALHYRANKKFDAACKKMEQAISKAPSFSDAYSQLGQWYFEAHKFSQAAMVFRNASAKCPNGRVRFAKPLAKSLIYSGFADEALQVIYAYGTTIKDSSEWRKMRLQAEFVRTAMMNPVPERPENMGIRVNTPDPELFPCISTDTQTLYFTRRIKNTDEDLYYSNADSCGGWFSSHNLSSLNTPDQELAQFISTDGHYMLFTRCQNRSWDAWTEGGCDLFMSYRVAKDSDWTTAQPFGATINTPAYEGMSTLSPDNRELYFVSDRPGGYGGYDIWISRFDNGLWQLPVNAGPDINTAGNETAPFIAVDNRTLFFTSDGWPGMGGSDIFMSKRINEKKWDRAQNLGYPINTAYDEKSEFVTPDGSKMYFSSDRSGPAGNYDIYETPLPPFLQPIPTGNIEGYVYDSLSKQRLNYTIMYVCNAASGDTLYQFQSNRGDASFLISLAVGKTYAIHSLHVEYSMVHDTLVFDTSYLHKPLIHNVVMLPADYKEVKPVHDSLVATIHFDKNKVELTDSDKSILYTAMKPWLDSKGIVVFVNAYTDNTGTPMLNEELSYKRAGIISKELQVYGLDESMIQAKGWGEAKMIAPNETEEGQRKNRRVEIILRR